MLHVRVSETLKGTLELSAKEAGRSMNAEIVQRLEAGGQDDGPLIAFLREEAAELEHLVQGSREEYERLSKDLRELRERIIDKGAVDDQAIGELVIERRWAGERATDYERRLRRIKRVLGK